MANLSLGFNCVTCSYYENKDEARMHGEVGRSEEDRLQLSKNAVAARGQHQQQQVAGEMSTQQQQHQNQHQHQHQYQQLEVVGPIVGLTIAPSCDASVGSTSTAHTLSSAYQDVLVSSSHEHTATDKSVPNASRRRRRRPAHDDASKAMKIVHGADTIHALRAENNRLREEMRNIRRALHRSSAVTTQDDQTELIMQLKLEIAELSTNLDEARMATLAEKEAGDGRLAELQSVFAETQRQLVEAKSKGGSAGTVFVVAKKDQKDKAAQSATSTTNETNATEKGMAAADEARFQALQKERVKSDQETTNARRELDEDKKENQRLQRVQEITRSLQTDKVEQTKDKIEELEKQLAESKLQIAELKSELEGSEHISNQLMEETSQLAEQISSMTQEKMDAMAKIKKYKRVAPSMKQSLTKLQKDKIELRVRLEGAEVLAEDFKKRYIRLGESLANISLEEMENLLHKEDLDTIREDRERKEQEKKGKLRRIFEGSTIGMALTETIGPNSGEKAGEARRRRSLSDAAFHFGGDLHNDETGLPLHPPPPPHSSGRLGRRARSFDYGEINVQQMLDDTNSVDGTNIIQRRPRRSRRTSNLSSGSRRPRSRSVDPSEMRFDVDVIGIEEEEVSESELRRPGQMRRSSAIVASSRRRSSSADPYSTKRSSVPSRRSGSNTGSLADSLANVLEGVYSTNRTVLEAHSSGGIESIAESSINSLGDDWIEKCVVTAFQFDECNSDSAALNVDLDDVVTGDEGGAEERVTEMPSAEGESVSAKIVDA